MTDRYPQFLPAPRHLVQMLDDLRLQIIRLQDERAVIERKIVAWENILGALGWLKNLDRTLTPGYPQEDAEPISADPSAPL